MVLARIDLIFDKLKTYLMKELSAYITKISTERFLYIYSYFSFDIVVIVTFFNGW